MFRFGHGANLTALSFDNYVKYLLHGLTQNKIRMLGRLFFVGLRRKVSSRSVECSNTQLALRLLDDASYLVCAYLSFYQSNYYVNCKNNRE